MGSFFINLILPRRELYRVKYYENGNKESEIHFKETENVNEANLKTGVWKYWDKNGNLMREEIYKNGELVDSKEYISTKVRD